MGGWICYDAFIASQWPGGVESLSCFFGAGASNIVVGTNPPYSATDFFAFYPKFGGTPFSVTGTLTNGSAAVTAISSTVTTLMANQLIAGTGIPGGTTIVSVTGPSTLTMSQNATASGTGVAITLFPTPIIPLVVVNVFIALASASLVQARYLDHWAFAMGLYINHFCTLYLRSDGDIYSTPGQAAAAGLARGIATSKGAGPASMGFAQPAGMEEWGAWTQTEAGIQFCQIAKIIGCGASLVY